MKRILLSVLPLVIPLALSAFTHLWNLTGFPSVYVDEGHYMRRAMHILHGLAPQENAQESFNRFQVIYDHPYFGQLFLAGVLGIVGYPLLSGASPLNNFNYNKTSKFLFIEDDFIWSILDPFIDVSKDQESSASQLPLIKLYNGTKIIATFRGNINDYNIEQYPYTSMKFNNQLTTTLSNIDEIKIRTNLVHNNNEPRN